MTKNGWAWLIAIGGVALEIAIATVREWWPE